MAFFVKSIHFTEYIRCNVAYLQTIVFEMFPSVIFFRMDEKTLIYMIIKDKYKFVLGYKAKVY